MSVADTLCDRQSKYGDFSDVAFVAQELKGTFARSKNWISLPVEQKEALDLIATKLARMLCGDPRLKDSWHDLAGYAALAERVCDR